MKVITASGIEEAYTRQSAPNLYMMIANLGSTFVITSMTIETYKSTDNVYLYCNYEEMHWDKLRNLEKLDKKDTVAWTFESDFNFPSMSMVYL